ncbi:MAG: hypothetical protein ABSF32_04025 [Ignavibacteria bacterium]|jgi:hypothetical protein
MKTITSPLLIITFLLILTGYVFSQNQTNVANILSGKTYKIVLFDDTEIFGKVISVDSANITVETQNRAKVIVPRNNILYYTTDLTPSKYNCLLSLLGGVSLFSKDNDYNTYNNGSTVGPNFDLGFIYFLSGTKAVQIDAAYTYYKAKYDFYNNYNTDPHYQETFSGGNASLFSFKGSIMFGRFEPAERIILCASLGLGIHYTAQQQVTESYWYQPYPDTTWKQGAYITPAHNDLNALISIGGSMGYRFSKKLGVKVEMEYDIVTGGYAFFFLGGRNYFALRGGIFYIF